MNVSKPNKQTTIATLLQQRCSQREIERVTGIDRKTIRAYKLRFEAELANSSGVATGAEPATPARLCAEVRMAASAARRPEVAMAVTVDKSAEEGGRWRRRAGA